MVFSHAHRYLCGLLFVGVSIVAGCDSGDPISQASCKDVDGRYAIAAFEFDPIATSIPTVSFLDTLDATQTELRLTDQCQYVFTYKFKGQETQLITNDYRVTESNIRLNVKEGDRSKLSQLYLTEDVVLDRLADRALESDITTTVNLGDFSKKWEGTTAEGEMRLRFSEPQTGPIVFLDGQE